MDRYPATDGTWTAGFDQPRPLGSEKPTHKHAAQDIGNESGEPVLAPEDGEAFGFAALRPKRMFWKALPVVHGRVFDWANYFYDTFGGLVVVRGDSGVTHIIAHSWLNQIFNLPPLSGEPVSTFEPPDHCWPVALWTDAVPVHAGQRVGSVGSAGFSTGPHVHWEIHEGDRWQRHENRIDPAAWLRRQ